jgi:hypothetical protein
MHSSVTPSVSAHLGIIAEQQVEILAWHAKRWFKLVLIVTGKAINEELPSNQARLRIEPRTL